MNYLCQLFDCNVESRELLFFSPCSSDFLRDSKLSARPVKATGWFASYSCIFLNHDIVYSSLFFLRKRPFFIVPSIIKKLSEQHIYHSVKKRYYFGVLLRISQTNTHFPICFIPQQTNIPSWIEPLAFTRWASSCSSLSRISPEFIAICIKYCIGNIPLLFGTLMYTPPGLLQVFQLIIHTGSQFCYEKEGFNTSILWCLTDQENWTDQDHSYRIKRDRTRNRKISLSCYHTLNLIDFATFVKKAAFHCITP